MEASIIKNGNTVVIQGCNLGIMEIDGNICVAVTVDDKVWYFGKRRNTIDEVVENLKLSGLVPVDVSRATEVPS